MPDAEWLKQHELYRDLTYEDIRFLGDYTVEQTFRRGAPIVEEGDSQNPGASFIKSGSAKVAIKIKNVEKVLAFFRGGDFFGEMSLVQSQLPRSASVVAVADTTVFVLTHSNYERLKRDHPSTVFRLLEIFLKVMANRLRETSKRVQ